MPDRVHRAQVRAVGVHSAQPDGGNPGCRAGREPPTHQLSDALMTAARTAQPDTGAGVLRKRPGHDTHSPPQVFRRAADGPPASNPNATGIGAALGTCTDGVRTTADVQTKTKVGRHKNVWYSFGYRYVMPQVAAWKFKATQSNPRSPSFACVSSGAPKASYLSLDRTTVPDRLLMGEYCRPQVGGHPSTHYPSTGRIASYPVAALEQRSGAVAAQGWANYLPLPDGGAQGAAAHNGKLYVNVSRGKNRNGHLHRAAWDKSALTLTGQPIESATGLEDLYVERGSGRLWSISEHGPKTKECGSLCHRVLYAHRLSSVGARR